MLKGHWRFPDFREERKIFCILYLHLLKTLVEVLALGIFFGLSWLFFDRVPLGRFNSSRPSLASQTQIVSE